MIFKRSTEPSNKDFFTRVVPVIPYVIWAGIIFQIISALTEAFGIYQFGNALNSPLFINLFFTIIVVIGWEFLIRVSTQYIFKTAALKIHKGLFMHKLEFFLLFLAILLGAPLIYYSYSVSKENAHMTFEFMMPERDTSVVAAVTQSKRSELSEIESGYISRKSEIEKRYADREKAAAGIYNADKTTFNTKINEWQAKEKKNNKKYTSQIDKYKDQINNSYRSYKSESKELTDAKDKELAGLTDWRGSMEGGTISLAGDNIKEDQDRQATFQAWFKKYSYIWSHFAGLSSLLAVLCVIFVVVFNVLAGIDEETHLTPENLEPGLLSEMYYLLQLKTVAPIRNRVRTAINSAASKRVTLEIVTPSTISVTPISYTPPHITSEARTVTHPLRSEPVTPPRPVTESVTEIRYGIKSETPKHELPTVITPVTTESVTHFEGSAVPKPKPVTASEAIVVDLDPTVTGRKPVKVDKPVTDDNLFKIIMVTPTKAIITNTEGEKETVTLQQVGSRKRSNFGNIKKRKTKVGKDNARRLYEFYADLEERMKEAKK